MKRLISIFLCQNFLCLNFSYAITDELVETCLDKNLLPITPKVELIKDNLVNDLDNTITINNLNNKPIEDFLINAYFVENNSKKPDTNKDSLEDSLVNKINKTENPFFQSIITKDFSDLDKPSFLISPKTIISTGNFDLSEGEYVDFETILDSTYNGKIYPRGTKVKGRIETITMNGAFGAPAEIIINNFIVDSRIKADGCITKSGANRSLWVYPLGYSTTLLFGVGVLLFAVRGGHAKLRPSDEYKIYALE